MLLFLCKNTMLNHVAIIRTRSIFIAPIFMAFGCMLLAGCQSAPKDTVKLTLYADKTHILHAKIADDESTRAQGLMFVSKMPANQGMLFVFDQDTKPCFWMKNTQIPLSLAYLDSHGVIVQFADMTPFDLTTHCAKVPVRYALEVNQGYFASHKIGIGVRVDIATPTK